MVGSGEGGSSTGVFSVGTPATTLVQNTLFVYTLFTTLCTGFVAPLGNMRS